jgi:hypothetical protein
MTAAGIQSATSQNRLALTACGYFDRHYRTRGDDGRFADLPL